MSNQDSYLHIEFPAYLFSKRYKELYDDVIFILQIYELILCFPNFSLELDQVSFSWT